MNQNIALCPQIIMKYWQMNIFFSTLLSLSSHFFDHRHTVVLGLPGVAQNEAVLQVLEQVKTDSLCVAVREG